MPITKSAQKALRQSLRKRAQNLAKKEAFKTAIKSYKKSPKAETLAKVFQALDKAAKTNVIHKNHASRLKSRLSKLLVVKP